MITYNGQVVKRVLFGGKEVERLYFRGILVFQKEQTTSLFREEQKQNKELQELKTRLGGKE